VFQKYYGSCHEPSDGNLYAPYAHALKLLLNRGKLIITFVMKHLMLMSPLCFLIVNEDTGTDIMETSYILKCCPFLKGFKKKEFKNYLLLPM
jgi:hypothetical protein